MYAPHEQRNFPNIFLVIRCGSWPSLLFFRSSLPFLLSEWRRRTLFSASPPSLAGVVERFLLLIPFIKTFVLKNLNLYMETHKTIPDGIDSMDSNKPSLLTKPVSYATTLLQPLSAHSFNSEVMMGDFSIEDDDFHVSDGTRGPKFRFSQKVEEKTTLSGTLR